jgi:hypothetical protein
MLARRNTLNQVRLPTILLAKVFPLGFISILVIIIYAGLSGSKESVQNRNGALFFISLELGF